jgi:hypothetical protein
MGKADNNPARRTQRRDPEAGSVLMPRKAARVRSGVLAARECYSCGCALYPPKRDPRMRFSVGPWIYDVMIHDGPLFCEDGGRAIALYIWDLRALLITSEIGIYRRTEVLIHELRHAWQLHFGMPRDDEEDANSAASFTIDFHRQFCRQGGEGVLCKMRPRKIAYRAEGQS